MADIALAPKIYNHLMNGRIINREVIDNDNYVMNPMFVQIMDNLAEYEKQYEMCGFNMIKTGDYVYLCEKKASEDLKTDVGMHVQILLLLIGKYLNRKNLSLSKITTLSAGISLAEVEDVGKMEEAIELLDKARVKMNFADAFTKILVRRSIFLEKTTSKSYVLSSIGVKFFEELAPLYARNDNEFTV